MTLKRPSVSPVTALRVTVLVPRTNRRPSPGPRKTTSVITRLCQQWQAERQAFLARDLSEVDCFDLAWSEHLALLPSRLGPV
jgi:hypothetical protein